MVKRVCLKGWRALQSGVPLLSDDRPWETNITSGLAMEQNWLTGIELA